MNELAQIAWRRILRSCIKLAKKRRRRIPASYTIISCIIKETLNYITSETEVPLSYLSLLPTNKTKDILTCQCVLVSRLYYIEKLSINNNCGEKCPNLKEHFLLAIPLICTISFLSLSLSPLSLPLPLSFSFPFLSRYDICLSVSYT